jgi:glucose/arabinose dehydrogenase
VSRVAVRVGLLLALLGLGSCHLVARCLPERYAVNAPLGQMILGRSAGPPPAAEVGERLRVPEGFAIELYASGLPNARVLRFTPSGDLLVSTPRSGRVMLLERDRDGRLAGVRPLLEGLERPHGLDFFEGWIYVAETGRVVRVRYDAPRRQTSGPVEPVVSGLPAGGNHWTRTLRFGPDGSMYLSIGSSCNVCVERDPRRAALLRYGPDGSGEEIVATGLRNAVGFDWQPGSGALYATDNGRDLLGDDFPPCELNRIVPGGFYGWPFANGDRVPDPDLGQGREAEIERSLPPAFSFPAHNAPLGITFLRSEDLPAAYHGAALVALHGSWNRTRKDGYKIVALRWNADGSIGSTDFVTGFLRDEKVIGRPVDAVEGPDGAVYFSDDYAGAVYRVRWRTGGAQERADAPGLGPAEGEGTSAVASLAAMDAAEREEGLTRGRALFETHDCGQCHDPARRTPGVVPVVLSGLAARYDVERIESFLATPTPPMPPVPDAAERRALAVFLLAERGR